MPTAEGAELFVDVDPTRLDPADGPLQLAVYGPLELSAGEHAVVVSRFEADLFAYARQAAVHGVAWKRCALLAALELTILGLLVAFMVMNPDRLHFMIGWTLPLGFFAASLEALRAFRARRSGRAARRLLAAAEVLTEPATSRAGESTAYVRDLWRLVERGTVGRDLASLEHAAGELLHWSAGLRFYRRQRRPADPAVRDGLWRRAGALLLGETPAPAATQMRARAP